MKEALRFTARLIATPILALCFGVFWIGSMAFIGVMFSVFGFLDGHGFSWREHLKECNEAFRDPMRAMWGKKP